MSFEIDRRVKHRRSQDGTKSVLQSRTCLCAFVGIVASVAGMFGYDLSCEEQGEFGAHVGSFITLVSSFGAFLFRLLASKKIG